MSTQPIYMPDMELWGTNWLRSALANHGYPGIYVDNQIPDPRRDRMVIVGEAGGLRQDALYASVRLAINVFGSSAQDANTIARLAEGLLLSIRAADPVAYVSSSAGISTIADAQPRKYFVVSVTTRGNKLL